MNRHRYAVIDEQGKKQNFSYFEDAEYALKSDKLRLVTIMFDREIEILSEDVKKVVYTVADRENGALAFFDDLYDAKEELEKMENSLEHKANVFDEILLIRDTGSVEDILHRIDEAEDYFYNSRILYDSDGDEIEEEEI